VELDVEDAALSPLEELSLFLLSPFDSDFDSEDLELLALLDSPFWPLRA
jgi:hypothetical protein